MRHHFCDFLASYALSMILALKWVEQLFCHTRINGVGDPEKEFS